MMDRPVVKIKMAAKHMLIALIDALETYLFGSRGSLKSSLALSQFAIRRIYEMPRSTGVIIALSYEHFDKNTLEPLLKGWAMSGYIADVHYVIDKKPPDHWPKPFDFKGNEKYGRTITWCNGTVIKIISLARTAAANAVSAQWGMFDETKFMRPDKLAEIFPIFRGYAEEFKNCSGYLSKFFATDKLADPAEIEWLLNKRELVDHKKVEDVIAVQLEVNKLKAQLKTAGQNKKKQLQKLIDQLEIILRHERQDMVYVSEINCYDVLPIMGIQWLKSAKRNAKSKRIWEVAYENKDPDKPGETFYPSYKEEVHGHEHMQDVDRNKPFIFSLDYQHSVIPMPVAQIGKLPGEEKDSLNYVDYIYGLYPEGLKITVQKFCSKYKDHEKKTVYYVYDHTAIGKRIDADEYTVSVKKEFELYGWNVIEVFTGQAPGHYQKYGDTIDWMEHQLPDMEDEEMEDPEYQQRQEELANTMEIRINKIRCAKMILAIIRAGVKTVNGKTEKEKKYENTNKFPDLDQSLTTHVTDAFDMINDAVLKQKLITFNQGSVGFGFR